jgi:anti-sigma factor (TIGR02949 family)
VGADCGKALDRLEQYLDGELPDETLAEVTAHLIDCFPCMERADFERRVRTVVRIRCVDQAPAELHERVRVRIRTVHETWE